METPQKDNKVKEIAVCSLACELGYMIAIPVIAFTLIGRYADKALGTSPWLLLAGVILSVTVSTVIIYKKVTKIM